MLTGTAAKPSGEHPPFHLGSSAANRSSEAEECLYPIRVSEA